MTETVDTRVLAASRTVSGAVSYLSIYLLSISQLANLKRVLDGFSGAQKVFLLEFSMPLTNSTAFAGDMPAIWLLNAQIPLTSQYGTNPECSW